MKLNQHHQMMSLFLMLLISLSFQIRFEDVKETKQVLGSKDTQISSSPKQNLTRESNTTLNNTLTHKKDEKIKIKQAENLEYLKAKLIHKETRFKNYYPQFWHLVDVFDIDCREPNTGINSIRLTTRNNTSGLLKIGYNYTCVNSPKIKSNCKNWRTVWTEVSNITYPLQSIGKIFPKCKQGTVMSRLKMVKDRSPISISKEDFANKADLAKKSSSNETMIYVYYIRYRYMCCEADIVEDKYFENEKTPTENFAYLNLLQQPINARDFNVLSSFYMLLPKDEMYYGGRVSVLKGETSPYFSRKNFLDSIEKSDVRTVKASVKRESGKEEELMRKGQNFNLKKSGKKSTTRNESSSSSMSKSYLGKYVYLNNVK